MIYFKALEPSIGDYFTETDHIDHLKRMVANRDLSAPFSLTHVTAFLPSSGEIFNENDLPDWIESNLQENKIDKFSEIVHEETVMSYINETSEADKIKTFNEGSEAADGGTSSTRVVLQNENEETNAQLLEGTEVVIDHDYGKEQKAKTKIKQKLKSKIKVSIEDSTDEFTSWLLSFKPIKKSRLNKKDKSTKGKHKLVEELVRKSLTKPNILSETYADLLLKQGKYAQAIEIFTQLIEIFPNKALIFADKIKVIKNKIND
jgi:tetratricopeptide (TPR) repeat protein